MTKKNIERQFALYQGTRSEIAEPVTNGEHAAWLLMLAGDEIETYTSISVSSFYDALGILTHVANGDFDGWEFGLHFPKYPVKVPKGFKQSLNSLTADGSELRKLPDGTWALYKKGRIVQAPVDAVRAAYHDLVDRVVGENTFALNIIGYLGAEYARKVVETLNLGKGQAGPAAAIAIAASRSRNALYQAERRIDTTGETPKSNGGVRVRSENNIDFNMSTLVAGAQFRIVTADGADEGSTQAWEPGSADHAIMMDNLRLATASGLRGQGPQP